MMMSGFCSAIFFTAAAPLLTATTSYPASERIFLPMFWAVMLSSANRILSDTSNTFVQAARRQTGAFGVADRRAMKRAAQLARRRILKKRGGGNEANLLIISCEVNGNAAS